MLVYNFLEIVFGWRKVDLLVKLEMGFFWVKEVRINISVVNKIFIIEKVFIDFWILNYLNCGLYIVLRGVKIDDVLYVNWFIIINIMEVFVIFD